MTDKDFAKMTNADLDQWKVIAVREYPDEPPQQTCKMAPDVSSFATVVRGVHTLIVAKLDNGQTVIWNVNPFIARQLALNLLAVGQHMKWLDQSNKLTPNVAIDPTK